MVKDNQLRARRRAHVIQISQRVFSLRCSDICNGQMHIGKYPSRDQASQAAMQKGYALV